MGAQRMHFLHKKDQLLTDAEVHYDLMGGTHWLGCIIDHAVEGAIQAVAHPVVTLLLRTWLIARPDPIDSAGQSTRSLCMGMRHLTSHVCHHVSAGA